MRVVVASSIEISIEQFLSCIGSHDNFARTKTEGLVRYFPGNKSILKVHSLNSNNFMRRWRVQRTKCERSIWEGWGDEIQMTFGESNECAIMYALRTYFYLILVLINYSLLSLHPRGVSSFTFYMAAANEPCGSLPRYLATKVQNQSNLPTRP